MKSLAAFTRAAKKDRDLQKGHMNVCEESDVSVMAQPREVVDEAVQLETESTQEVEAALTEKDRGGPGVSLGLLRDAIEKERDSLDLMEQGIESLREGIEQRRRALELQEQVLSELADSYQEQGVEV